MISDLINKGFWTALDWIYPPLCAGCGQPGFRLCPDCLSKIKIRGNDYCVVCAQKLKEFDRVCQKCKTDPHSFTAIRCLSDYEGVIRECIHSLKYQKNLSLGDIFADMLAELVLEEKWEINLILPVPLSTQRKAERGYNQAAHLAKPLAARLGVAYHPYGLKRVRNTRSQVGLSAEERHLNVNGAFEALPDIVSGRRVLVVDDVMTTGSTLSACADTLFKTGAHTIFCLALAGYPEKRNVAAMFDHLV